MNVAKGGHVLSSDGVLSGQQSTAARQDTPSGKLLYGLAFSNTRCLPMFLDWQTNQVSFRLESCFCLRLLYFDKEECCKRDVLSQFDRVEEIVLDCVFHNVSSRETLDIHYEASFDDFCSISFMFQESKACLLWKGRV